MFEQLHDVLPVCENQQAKKEYHSHDLGIFHEFITGFTPENYFVKQEHFKRKFEELIMLLDSLNVIDSRDDLQKLVGSHKVPYLTDRISYTIRMLNYAAKKAHP